MPRTSREIKARFLREKNVFESEDLESRVVIAEVTLIERDDAGNERLAEKIQVKGEAYAGSLTYGLDYRFFGRWFQHHLYGEQFHYESFVVDKPASRDAVIAYLKQCKGIGSVKASKLFDIHGESSIDKLISSPRDVANEVKLKVEDAESAALLLIKSEHVRKAKLDLIKLVGGKSFPRKLVDQLVRDHGSEAADIVRRNPYWLMNYRGCGFLKTDKLYCELGHDPSRLKRQALCAWHAIAKVSEGDTWFPYSQAVRAIRENVSGTATRVDRAIELAIRSDLLRVREGIMGQKWIAESKKARHEERVARLIAEAYVESRDKSDLLSWPEVSELNVSDHQREALKSAFSGGFICNLAGSPGTGKTHSTAEVMKSILETHGADHVAACAPSGKAAVRMSEALEKARVPLRATTIHSMLGVLSSEDGWSFEFNEKRPLPFMFIFADESSMDDVALLGSLLAARGVGTHVCFVGDIHQLSPVGHGAPMRDMMAAGLPTGTLTKIERNWGRIVDACAEIRDHKRFTYSEKIDLATGENLGLIERETAEDQIEAMKATIERFANSDKYDPVWQVQVLCAVNKKSSDLNRKKLNQVLQKQLNQNGHRVDNNPFWIGDKVICLKNSWLKPVIRRPGMIVNHKGEVYVANGEQGEVVSVGLSRFVVRLQNPDREVLIYRSGKTDEDEDESRDPNDEAGEESAGTGCKWDLGYAISVHKSQGSEWPVVIVMLDDSGAAKMVCTRNWLYTAISRAKVLGLLIGTKSRAQEMCQKDGLQRKTFLTELIREGIAKADQEFERRLIDQADAMWTEDVFTELLEGVC